jgi:hypothetical protein
MHQRRIKDSLISMKVVCECADSLTGGKRAL